MDTSKIHIIVRKISPLLCLFVTQPPVCCAWQQSGAAPSALLWPHVMTRSPMAAGEGDTGPPHAALLPSLGSGCRSKGLSTKCSLVIRGKISSP